MTIPTITLEEKYQNTLAELKELAVADMHRRNRAQLALVKLIDHTPCTCAQLAAAAAPGEVPPVCGKCQAVELLTGEGPVLEDDQEEKLPFAGPEDDS